jgi:hypothetical protein
MARVLTARNAVINTAAVQIKTLTVAGKQVTLAVFRQLIEEDIFDFAAGALRGVGWGHVRYLIDQPAEQAIHLVWQRGADLRRCILERDPEHHWTRQRADKALADPIFYQPQSGGGGSYLARGINTSWRTWWFDDGKDFRLPHPYLAYLGYNTTTQDEEKKRENSRALAAYTAKIRAEMAPVLDHVVQICEAYRELVVPLFDLPQLFIAV